MATSAVEELTDAWIGRLETALLKVENSIRRRDDLPLVPRSAKYWAPKSPAARLRLLNFKVWSVRYCVPPEFILHVLFEHYRYVRQSRQMDELTLGVGIPQLTGAKSRQVVEEAVLKTYPSGENYRDSKLQMRARFWNLRPIGHLRYSNLDEMNRAYTEAIKHRRKLIDRSHPFTRPWRGNPWR